MAATAPSENKPRALAVHAEVIPAALKELSQWVVWRYDQDVDVTTGEVSWDKPPRNARTGGLADSTNPKTWGTWGQALAAYQRGGLDGVGFVLHREKNAEGPGLVGIDLDHCRDPQTGAIEPWARQIIDKINSYTEVSPSGCGVRMFIYGQPPATGRKKRGDYENYATGRYVTVTGQHIEGTPITVEHRQAELEAVQKGIWGDPQPEQTPSGGGGLPSDLADLDIVERASRAKRMGAKFSSLWNGNVPHGKSRSEADLALCNYLAFWCGPDAERIASLFAQSGLFRSKWQREDYRQRTIAKALAGRDEYYDWSKRRARAGPGKPPPNGDGKHQETDPATDRGEPTGGFQNFTEVEVTEGEKTRTVRIGLPISNIGKRLLDLTAGWPKRVGEALFVEGPGHIPQWLLSTDAVFAWVGGLLPAGGGNRLRWATGDDKVTQAQFFAYLQQAVERFDSLELYPHEPPLPRHFYMHPAPRGGDGKALRAFQRRFCPATPADADLMLAATLTLFWGGAPGERPAFLVEADSEDREGGRGVGKTTFAQAVGRLAGDYIEMRPGEDVDRFTTRLLSPTALQHRVALLDNVKSLRFSNGELEGLITSDVLSGRQLYVGEGRRPNTLLWFLTVNAACMSKDMAQRSVVIRLRRPPRDPGWEQETWRFVDRHRWEIIGDALAELRRPVERLKKFSRWSAWEQGVLAHVADPAEAQKVTEERQGAVDGDQEESDLVRQAFIDLLRSWRHDPETAVTWLSAQDAAEATNKATNENRPTQRVTSYLKTLAIPELRKSDRGTGKGWTWTGKKAPAGATAADLKDVS